MIVDLNKAASTAMHKAMRKVKLTDEEAAGYRPGFKAGFMAGADHLTQQKAAERVATDLIKGECEALEVLIDKRGISSVLMALSEICGAKAVHIAENWQDTALAKRWATLEGAVGVIVPKAGGL
jgi:hypothetical protein